MGRSLDSGSVEGGAGGVGRQAPKSFAWFISSKLHIPMSQTGGQGQESQDPDPEVAVLGGWC